LAYTPWLTLFGTRMCHMDSFPCF